ncbi:uncharacterized protein LOC107267081 isoform X2 [Cephus cinctus]|uniref:Uncharacterized protein LOC107267081 isoform X2 n=1 Tax=Cephus cinctus TaxID=211228 RepID=A0AAJ7FIS8_CEPCN|nr:uncharacterized protein LOC107267081 isoform X2 [Cephus cinctus]
MSETRHHLRSVSDLYAADEIEVLLLKDIHDLEPPPTAYSRPEDIQDFEIAGSRTGGQISSQSSELESPGVHSTVHSWDSHANYHGHYGHSDHHRLGSSSNAPPWPRTSHLVFYCDIQGHLRTATGVIRLLLLISSAACLATLCSSGTAKVSLFMLPLVGRLRLMIFVAVFCLLVTALLLFLDISHVIHIFPFNWAKLNAWVFTGIGISYLGSSSLLVCSVWEYAGSGWVPRRTRSQLAAAAALGLSCALLAFILSWFHKRSKISCKGQLSHQHTPNQLYKPVDNSSSSGVTLKERSPKRPPSWVVRNHSKKRNADSETNTNNSNRENGNGNCDKYKSRGNKKGHWASARQHFLPSHENDEVDDAPRDELDTDRKRRRKRKDGGNSLGTDGNLSAKAGSSISAENTTKARRVPRKLPLQTMDRSQLRTCAGHGGNSSKQDTAKTGQLARKSELENYWTVGDTRHMEATGLAMHWEVEGTSYNKRESIDVTLVQAAMWDNQWHPPPDDVQPCSSKAIDPYTFP